MKRIVYRTILILNFIVFLGTTLSAQIITTVAGSGLGGSVMNNVPATSTPIGGSLVGLAFDDSDNYYFTLGSPGYSIHKVSNSGIVQTIAGTGIAGYSGDGGMATNAMLNGPVSITLDKKGNIFFSDQMNCRIRKIDRYTNIITTYAGNGIPGYSGDGGAATSASLQYQVGICFDAIGNLYIADRENYRIRVIDTFGVIHPYAGIGISGYSGEGGFADSAKMEYLQGLCFDNFGNLFLSESYRICKIDHSTKIITRVTGNGTYGNTGDEGLADTAILGSIAIMAFNSSGELFLSDQSDFSVIRKIDALGFIHRVAGTGVGGYNGDGINASIAQLYQPRGIAFDSCGNLLVCDNGNKRIRKIAFTPACLPLSTEEITSYTEVSIYPNPTTTEVNIDNVTTTTDYTITNITGITEQIGSLHAGNNTIALQSLPPGIYIIELTGDDGKKTMKKIVKE